MKTFYDSSRHPVGRLKRKLGRLLMQFVPQKKLAQYRPAIIYAIKNRSGWRIDNCLQSLEHQTFPRPCTEIILVDFGSSNKHEAKLRTQAEEYRCKLIRLHKYDEIFCKPLALNIGIKAVTKNVNLIFSSDIDMIYAPNFVEQALRALHFFKPAMVSCQAKYLPEARRKELVNFDYTRDFERLQRKAEPKYGGCGTLLAASKEWYYKVHGYDEFYRFWGFEDNDLLDRAINDGLEHVGIADRTCHLHQWHERVSDGHARGTGTEEDKCVAEAREYYRTHSEIVRNPKGWGELGPEAEVLDFTRNTR